MKLMLRPSLRLWPLTSACSVLDLKTGVVVAILFALLNKVAGIYGLLALLAGAGGSFAQLSLYLYSVVALVALAWGLRAVQDEDPKHTLYFAHLFAADHIFSTSWTIFFAVVWWLWTPHDGQRQTNSPAQQKIKDDAHITLNMTQSERELAARQIWDYEKTTAASVIIVAWLFKIYFVLLIYSYATQLRKGPYRSLPRSRALHAHTVPKPASALPLTTYDDALALADDEPEGGIAPDAYRVPLRMGHARTHSRKSNRGSRSSFADFVSAPGRRPRGTASVSLSARSGIPEERNADVLFDEESTAYAPSSSSRAQSKLGTDSGSTAASTDEERPTDVKGKARAAWV